MYVITCLVHSAPSTRFVNAVIASAEQALPCCLHDSGRSRSKRGAYRAAVVTYSGTLATGKDAAFCCIASCLCRYEGQFTDGQRHGYGALFYATGGSYEGEWQLEQKHGKGVFTFEDGTVFDGMFADDQAVIGEGQVWGPVGSGPKLRVHDLLEDSVGNKQVLCWS